MNGLWDWEVEECLDLEDAEERRSRASASKRRNLHNSRRGVVNDTGAKRDYTQFHAPPSPFVLASRAEACDRE